MYGVSLGNICNQTIMLFVVNNVDTAKKKRYV